MSIEVSGLVKIYGEQKAVNDISFQVKKGEIVGFLGPNGAGKSTTIKIITGFLKSNSGNATVCGIDVSENPIEAKRKIGYLPESNALYYDMYVKEYLQFIAGVHQISNYKLAVENVLQLTGLNVEEKKKIGQLSKGYKQRVGLAAALIHKPEVIILDEPTSGLDPNQLVEIRELIKKIGEEKTVILSTHIMQEVEAICDRIVIISKGKIVANDKASILQNETTHQTVYVEFDSKVSKSQLIKIPNIQKVEAVNNAWLIETSADIDLRKEISQFAQKEKWLILTLKIEKKSLEEVFKDLTK